MPTYKERPIVLNGDMVRAVLDGRKTQTRRLMKPIPAYPNAYDSLKVEISEGTACFYQAGSEIPAYKFYCPFGKPGDRLWVREIWRIAAWRDHLCRCFACDYKASPEETHTPWIVLESQEWKKRVEKIYAELRSIDYPSRDGRYQWEHGKAPLRWHPSIHMPRWASRIDLLITDVRVERLQGISGDDAIAEGIEKDTVYQTFMTYKDHVNPIKKFNRTWDSIYGKKQGCSWLDNPWVWVVEFEQITKG